MPFLRRTIAQASSLLRVARAGARAHGASPVAVAVRARRVRRRGGWEYPEALSKGLLDPSLPVGHADGFVSKHAALEAQRRVNPEAMSRLTEEKAIFYRYCEAIGLPTPRLLALVGSGTGYIGAGQIIADRADFVRFMASDLPDEIVVKPSAGVHGIGVRVLRRRRDGRLEHPDGQSLSVAELYDQMVDDPAYPLWVIQERLRNAAQIADIGSPDTLQTIRVETFVRRDGSVEVLDALIRLAASGSAIDNFQGGATGNALAAIDVATGRLGQVRAPRPDGCGFLLTSDFPATGARVEGVVLDGWADVTTLVCRAATAFLPARTIGWDVGIVPEGLVIVEANMFWDPPGTNDQADVIRRLGS